MESCSGTGGQIAVSSKGLRLLGAFLAAPGEVLTKTELMESGWGDAAVEESNLSVQIAALRKQLGPTADGGDWIVTVPRVGYRFIGLPAQEPIKNDSVTPLSAEQAARPSIAVLPFVNLGGESDQDYLADGIAEDIITALTRFRWFCVIARNSSFAYKGKPLDPKQVAQELGVRYLLEGSVRKSGQPIRISVQLVEAASARHIWAERYDLELTEVFAIQDEIAERVAGAIEPELLKSEGAQAAARHTGNMTAWDLVRRGTMRALQVRPNWWTTLEVLICCYAALGKWNEARNCAQEMSTVVKQPGDVLAPLKAQNADWAEKMNEALNKAGA